MSANGKYKQYLANIRTSLCLTKTRTKCSGNQVVCFVSVCVCLQGDNVLDLDSTFPHVRVAIYKVTYIVFMVS